MADHESPVTGSSHFAGTSQARLKVRAATLGSAVCDIPSEL
jgi:hypothetical protein